MGEGVNILRGVHNSHYSGECGTYRGECGINIRGVSAAKSDPAAQSLCVMGNHDGSSQLSSGSFTIGESPCLRHGTGLRHKTLTVMSLCHGLHGHS